MVSFFWNNKYEDPMQATLAVHSTRRPLPRLPAPPRPQKRVNPISPLTEQNSGNNNPRPLRLPLSILNRSATRAQPPNPNSSNATKRTETAPALAPLLPRIASVNPPSLYSHSNHSGDLLSDSRSPTALVRSNIATHPTTTLHRRRLPSTSLLRSRRKLWKTYWLVVDLATIPESSFESEPASAHPQHQHQQHHQPRSRSGKPPALPLSPRKPPPSINDSEFQSTPTPTLVSPIVRPRPPPPPPSTVKHPSPSPSSPRASMPPPPELVDDDTSSDSSSSDEDLDAYEFDLSCMSLLEPSEDLLGPSTTQFKPPPVASGGMYAIDVDIADKPRDSRVQHAVCVVHSETDISSIYENIISRPRPRQRNLTSIPL